jgi:hypothetical protein
VVVFPFSIGKKILEDEVFKGDETEGAFSVVINGIYFSIITWHIPNFS